MNLLEIADKMDALLNRAECAIDVSRIRTGRKHIEFWLHLSESILAMRREYAKVKRQSKPIPLSIRYADEIQASREAYNFFKLMGSGCTGKTAATIDRLLKQLDAMEVAK